MSLHQLHRHDSEQTLCKLDGVNRDYIGRYLKQHLASTAASLCLQHNMQIGNIILLWYNAAIDTDINTTEICIHVVLQGCPSDGSCCAEEC